MRYVLLLFLCFFQLNSFSQNKIDYEIAEQVKGLKLPYRDLSLTISNKLDSTSAYYDIHRVIDAYLIDKNYLRSYCCHLRFDSYTDDVFVYFKIIRPDDYFNFGHNYLEDFFPIFISSSIESDTLVINNWLSHLDTCLKIEAYNAEIVDLQKSSVSFFLDKKGNVLTNNVIENSKLLKPFFENINKFSPGILNGLPLNVKVELPMPWDFDNKSAKPKLTVHYEFPFLQGVYFSKEIRNFAANTAVVSFVWNEQKWASPVYHSGSVELCSKLSDRFMSIDSKAPFPYVGSIFERIYFYTFNL